MPLHSRHHDNIITIILTESFTFQDSNDFREELNKALAHDDCEQLHINLEKIEFIDSSGLGMLMVVKNECDTHHIALQLHCPKGEVLKLLLLTKCNELFSIVD